VQRVTSSSVRSDAEAAYRLLHLRQVDIHVCEAAVRSMQCSAASVQPDSKQQGWSSAPLHRMYSTRPPSMRSRWEEEYSASSVRNTCRPARQGVRALAGSDMRMPLPGRKSRGALTRRLAAHVQQHRQAQRGLLPPWCAPPHVHCGGKRQFSAGFFKLLLCRPFPAASAARRSAATALAKLPGLVLHLAIWWARQEGSGGAGPKSSFQLPRSAVCVLCGVLRWPRPRDQPSSGTLPHWTPGRSASGGRLPGSSQAQRKLCINTACCPVAAACGIDLACLQSSALRPGTSK